MAMASAWSSAASEKNGSSRPRRPQGRRPDHASTGPRSCRPAPLPPRHSCQTPDRRGRWGGQRLADGSGVRTARRRLQTRPKRPMGECGRQRIASGCSGTEWNPKDPVALIPDYRYCSEGMWRDRMDPDGRPVGLLITQRSRVQIPPPPPSLTSTFGASPPLRRTAGWGLLSVICQWTARTSVRAVRLGGTIQDQTGHGIGGRGVHAGNDMAVDVQGDGDGGVAEALADHLGGDAGGQGRGRITVADIVQPDRRQPCGTGQSPEPVGDQVRVNV
jgi:hypothetical protein